MDRRAPPQGTLAEHRLRATSGSTSATSRPTLGKVVVTKVSTKMLTDLYGAHQARGLSARSVYQIHACISSMFTQACRWGWRDSNPAQWAEPPSIPNVSPVVPTPDEVRRLIDAADRSRRPEYARAILVAATTGLRRAELCACPVDSGMSTGIEVCSRCRRRSSPQGRAAAGDPNEEPARADARRRRPDAVDAACAGPVSRGAGQARPSRTVLRRLRVL